MYIKFYLIFVVPQKQDTLAKLHNCSVHTAQKQQKLQESVEFLLCLGHLHM